MDIFKALDLLERVEKDVSDLYRKLHQDYRYNKEAADFFHSMHMEEESHLQVVRMERRIVQASPKAFSEPRINLSEIHSLIETIASVKTQKMELPELLGRIYAIESSVGERYLFDAMKETNEDLREFLGKLGDSSDRYKGAVESFAQKLGIGMEAVQNHHLRSARVGFADRVIINGQLAVRGVDISEGGMFLLTGRSFPPGEALALQFEVLQTQVTVRAAVQFCIDEVGMGMRFTDLADDDRKLIERYVAQRIEGKVLEKERRVLLVGSHRLTGRDMRIYINALVGEGFKVVDISGFEDAVSALRKGLDLSCVILAIDTEQDGNYYLLSFLQTMEQYQHLPVLVVTSNQNAHFRTKMMKKGVSKLLIRLSTSPRRLIDEIKAATDKNAGS